MSRSVGIDVDGVLADLNSAVCQLVNGRYGLQLTKADITHWDAVAQLAGMSGNQYTRLMDEVWRNWQSIQSEEPNIPSLLKQLHRRGMTVVIITKRSQASIGDVVAWLDHQRMDYDELVVIRDRHKLEYPIDILVDDSPKAAERAGAFAPRQMLLRSQPWNANLPVLPGNVLRVATLRQAVCRVVDEWSVGACYSNSQPTSSSSSSS